MTIRRLSELMRCFWALRTPQNLYLQTVLNLVQNNPKKINIKERGQLSIAKIKICIGRDFVFVPGHLIFWPSFGTVRKSRFWRIRRVKNIKND
jgi:hypothetical protein